MIDLHPNATKRFNERAEEIANAVLKESAELPGSDSQRDGTISPDVGPSSQSASFDPDIHVSAAYTEKDIIDEPRSTKVDALGNTVAFMFWNDDQECWIEGDTYTEVIRVAEAVQKCPSIRDLLSRATIERALCEWIESRVTRAGCAPFVPHLENAATEVVEEIQLRAPVAGLFVEKAFTFGRLRFSAMARSEIDTWQEKYLGEATDHREKIAEYFKQKVRPLQGLAYAELTLRADPQRAQEILLVEAERAVALLRIFSIAALHPHAISPCVLFGVAQQDQTHLLKIKDGVFVGAIQALKGAPMKPIYLSEATLSENWELGCEALDRLLTAQKVNEFEQLIMDATLLYSRCTIAKSIADKLTYIFAALESVFLKNDTEPIQSNLSERMAFALVRSPDERAEVIRVVKDTYRLRSQFLHHGESVDDIQLVERFMRYAWHTMLGLMNVTGECASKDELLAELERRKLS